MPFATATAGSAQRVKKLYLKTKKSPFMSDEEKRLARDMHFNQHIARTQIAKTLGRDLGCVCRLLAQKKVPQRMGRPSLLTKADVDKLCALLEKMVDEADATWEVSLAMLMKRSRVKVCGRLVADALHKRGYSFRDLRHKPILTPEDTKKRWSFAKKFKGKSSSWWMRTVHIHIDNHHFKVATTARGRKLLAKRTVRGVYRKKGKSLRPGHVKPHPKMKLATGPKGILKAGGVGGGKVLVWYTIPGRWGGDAAEHLYTEVVAPALRKHYPRKRSFSMLEDNDPSGNQSGKGRKAKEASKLNVFEIPNRSPDLNVLDYAIWSAVERRMRTQEKQWPASKKETRSEFEKRLNRTARNLPSTFIDKCIGDMRRRCYLLDKAKGGLFEEGGRARRPL